MRIAQRVGAIIALLAILSTGCGSGSSDSAVGSAAELPIVVATTNILRDVLGNLAGEQFEVVTIMPVGSDPHDFQPSAQDVAAIDKAEAIIANGGSFEGGLLDAIDAAKESGTPVFGAITAVSPIILGEHGDDHSDDHDDEDEHDEHDDEDEHDDHGHEAGGLDPHFFTDPARMVVAADGILDFLIANVDTIDATKLRDDAEPYLSTLTLLDDEVETMLAIIPASSRVLVTNHEVFAYFADRYNFEVIGTVVPSGSSSDGVSGRRLAELVELLEREGVSAVFADTSSSAELAETLASEVGEVAVIKLYTESLGPDGSDGTTYVEMIRSNARLIAEALSS